MSDIGWSDLTITPDEEVLEAFCHAWAWKLEGLGTPVLFSVWGDVFLDRNGPISWLNTGIGELLEVASDLEDFRALLAGDQVDEWFLPDLVGRLHQAGLRPATGQCFTYVTYPVFAEGKYEVANIYVSTAREHFGLSGALHHQLAHLPDGAKVKLVVEPRSALPARQRPVRGGAPPPV